MEHYKQAIECLKPPYIVLYLLTFCQQLFKDAYLNVSFCTPMLFSGCFWGDDDSLVESHLYMSQLHHLSLNSSINKTPQLILSKAKVLGKQTSTP